MISQVALFLPELFMITPNVEGFSVVRSSKREDFELFKLFLYFWNGWPKLQKSVISCYRPLLQSDKTVLQSISDILKNRYFLHILGIGEIYGPLLHLMCCILPPPPVKIS